LDVISRNTSIISDKDINCVAHFETDYYVNTDSYLLCIIVNNILTNSIKYSKKGGSITIAIHEEDDALLCSISDHGIGIAKEDLQKIFDQFYRSKSNLHPEIKGTGLGLSIVKRLSLLLQIELEIESQENIGTKVILKFPK
jgi:signal transduction histidine kinase